MDALQFAYWLQGYAELTDDTPTAEQWRSIKEHLATVFMKVTPPVPGGPLKDIHPHRLPRTHEVIPTWHAETTGETPAWLRNAHCTAGGSAPLSYR
jgi:hypothetical protein